MRRASRPGRPMGLPGRFEPGLRDHRGVPDDRVTYVGHATVLLELEGRRVLTDPVLRRWVGPLRRQADDPRPDVGEGIDAILLSHLHMDHSDRRSLRRLDAQIPVLGPQGSGEFLRRAGFESVTELAPGDSETVAGLRVEATPAEHHGPRHPLSRDDVHAVGFRIGGRRRVYFAGDTDLFGEMEDLAGDLDLALLPVWGWGTSVGAGHLDPERAAQAAALLRPRIVVPIHWGTFFPLGLARWRREFLRDPPHRFARRAAELAPEVDVRVLRPGESTPLSR
jgi:L-ascorbate metabolism protein UlaG (beta-lactamase superfamily)